MRKKYNIYIIILILVVSLYSSSPLRAQDIGQHIGDIKELVSETHGSIRDSYFAGNNHGIIIHIQDLHSNYDAQMSIYHIIDELINKYNLNLVTVEGSVGRLETAPFSSYPDEKIKEEVAKYFVKTGKVNGAAFAHIMKKSGFVFWGVDDRSLYVDNLDAYKASIKGKSAATSYYNNIRSIIEKFKSKVYTPELKELDRNIEAYKKEEMDFSEYILYLNGLMAPNAIKNDAYPNFTKLTEVLQKESDIDFLEVDNQRLEYMNRLNEALDKKSLSELLDKSLYFKVGKLSAARFYAYLKELSLRDDTPAMRDDFQQLARYIDYIRLYSTIENIPLFKEIESIEDSAKEKLFTNNIQRKIDKLSHTLDILNDLFNLKLTKDTLQYYRDHRKEFMTSYFINFISENASKYGIRYKLDPSFRDIDPKLPDLEKFYKLAEERDSMLVFNTLNKMSEKRTKLAVLVSGGFHTDGITKLLKEKDMSYVVITPKVENLQKDNPHQSVLLGEKNGFDKFYDMMMEKKSNRR